jgi:hypothetical protein
MAKHHEPLTALCPAKWDDLAHDDLAPFLAETFSNAQTIIDSIPIPTAVKAAATTGRARSHTDSAVPVADLNRALSQRLSAAAIGHSQELLKEWKEVKVNAKENPLGINVYKLAAKDGKGSWFARRSIHEGLSFEKWKLGLEREFAETMKVQTGPGGGSIRGIGAERRVEHASVSDIGTLEGRHAVSPPLASPLAPLLTSIPTVFQLSAQFPGPTTPRDFVTLLLTSDNAGKTAAKDGRHPLRQFMVISKPCNHPNAPPRQGFIRGQYESVEIIREVPSDKAVMKRTRSSIDLSNVGGREASAVVHKIGKEAILRAARKAAEDEELPSQEGSRARGTSTSSAPADDDAAHRRRDESEEQCAAIEWIMVTRSDPGGSVPRFMVEKGTPGGIVGDAGKFLNWITSKDAADFATSDDNDFQAEAIKAEDHRKSMEVPRSPTKNLVPDNPPEQTEDVPSSNGLYGIIAGAFGAASSAVASHLPRPFALSTATTSIEEEGDDESILTETSSVHSFASALENTHINTLQPPNPDGLTPDMASTHSDESTVKSNNSSVTTTTPQEKELKKLQDRRSRLQEKIAKMQARAASKAHSDQEKDAAALARLREKHEREIAKQEEKYRRELKRLEERKEQEERKAEERRRKAAERQEKANLGAELEKVRAERDVARKQIEILNGQVGELQAQNTMLVAKLGRLAGGVGSGRLLDIKGNPKEGWGGVTSTEKVPQTVSS